MKQKLLLTFFIALTNLAAIAQKNTAYAITGLQKGNSNWTEVRLIDVTSGEELKPIYQSTQEAKILNARTGKPIAKKEPETNNFEVTRLRTDLNNNLAPVRELQVIRSLSDVKALAPTVTEQTINGQTIRRTVIIRNLSASLDKPFSTSSAACAYDKKHDRLYYTPLGIAQLRYIDLNSKTPQVFYFEDEKFGALRNRSDVPNQITRMVIGADGNGYALTNNAEHLIQFTTNKKATITDLGSLTDDAANGKYSVHSSGNYGGDIIAAKNGDLYLITSNHNVYKIDVKKLTATYKGSIQGLPRGYSTNGAAVEDGSMVLVNSSSSTSGYYRFDITKLVAEKVANNGPIFNASDLANSNLLTFKKEKKEEEQQVTPELVAKTIKDEPTLNENVQENRVSVYPNPVTNGVVTLSFENYAPGRYQAQLIDISGKQLSAKYITINSKTQNERFELPLSIAKGNYLLNIVDQTSKIAGSNKLVVQ